MVGLLQAHEHVQRLENEMSRLRMAPHLQHLRDGRVEEHGKTLYAARARPFSASFAAVSDDPMMTTMPMCQCAV